MRRVYVQETWPASWKFSYGFDLNEVFGEISHYGYAYAYENRRKMSLTGRPSRRCRVNEGAAVSVADRWRERHLFQSSLTLELRHHASLATGCYLVRKSAVQQVGGFNATLRAGEDADLGRRLLAADFDVIFDPQLKATSILSNSAIQVLERYARWNTLNRMSLRGYLRQMNYALKVMAAKDLRARDPVAACISLSAPHYQFWRDVISR